MDNPVTLATSGTQDTRHKTKTYKIQKHSTTQKTKKKKEDKQHGPHQKTSVNTGARDG